MVLRKDLVIEAQRLRLIQKYQNGKGFNHFKVLERETGSSFLGV